MAKWVESEKNTIMFDTPIFTDHIRLTNARYPIKCAEVKALGCSSGSMHTFYKCIKHLWANRHAILNK